MNRSLTLSCIVVLIAGSVAAGSPSFEGGADLVSSYLWRGIEFDDDLSLQPSLTVGYAFTDQTDISLNGWWNIALDDHDSPTWKDTVFEQDFTVALNHSVSDDVTMSFGAIYYSAPKSDVAPGVEAYQTDEVFVTIEAGFGRLAVSSGLYYDFDLFDAFYLEAGAAFDFALGAGFSLSPSLTVGFTDADDAWYHDDGLVHGDLGVAVARPVGEHLSIGGSLSYSKRFDRSSGAHDDGYVWAGLSVFWSS